MLFIYACWFVFFPSPSWQFNPDRLCLVMVKHENFKTCDQSGFCKRNRAYADQAVAAGPSWVSLYQMVEDTLIFKDGQLQAIIVKTINTNGENVRLPLTISFLESGTARMTIDEERRQQGYIELRHNSIARKERYNEAEKWAIVGGLELSKGAELSAQENGSTTIRYGPENKFEAVIRHSPFGVEFKRDGQIEIAFNKRGFMNIEHWRAEVQHEMKEVEKQTTIQNSEDERTWWEETFGGETDCNP